MATTGRYDEADGRPRIRFERTLHQPRPTVWAAITDPEQLGQALTRLGQGSGGLG